MPNSDTSVSGHYFHFIVTSSTLYDCSILLKFACTLYECKKEIAKFKRCPKMSNFRQKIEFEYAKSNLLLFFLVFK